MLEGISNDTDKANMAIMLENQAKQLVVEANTTGTGGTFTPGTGLPSSSDVTEPVTVLCAITYPERIHMSNILNSRILFILHLLKVKV